MRPKLIFLFSLELCLSDANKEQPWGRLHMGSSRITLHRGEPQFCFFSWSNQHNCGLVLLSSVVPEHMHPSNKSTLLAGSNWPMPRFVRLVGRLVTYHSMKEFTLKNVMPTLQLTTFKRNDSSAHLDSKNTVWTEHCLLKYNVNESALNHE